MTTKMIYRRRLLAETKLINSELKGNRIGYWEVYYNNGNLNYKGNYNNDGQQIGYWEYYYSNGNLNSKGNYDNCGKIIGCWEEYYSNGSLYEITYFKNK